MKQNHLIDGRSQALVLKATLKKRITKLHKAYGHRPGLAIIRVGEDPSSQVYVASKIKQSKDIGIRCFEYALPKSVKEAKVIAQIHEINDDPEMHGVIVQLPLPKHLNKDVVLEAIAPHKDVDGLHPCNFGRMVQGQETTLKPCTPLGILHLIQSVKKDVQGLHAVVVGASNLVGKPTAILLKHAGCSITILHSLSKNNAEQAKMADILVSATGVPNLITPDWVKPGAIVIDVGIRKDKKTGAISGDVEFETVAPLAAHITPVPGGVGPMTVAYLLSNVVTAFENGIHDAK